MQYLEPATLWADKFHKGTCPQSLRNLSKAGWFLTLLLGFWAVLSSLVPVSPSSFQKHTYLNGGFNKGYTWYHFSGLKKVVDAKNRAKVYLQETRQSLSEKHNPSRALVYLRKVAKTYVTPLPGAEVLVDEAFDSVDHIVETHDEEANLILTKAYQEIRDAIRLNGDQRSVTTAIQVMGVLKRRLSELQALGTKVGGDTLGPLWERFPDTQIGLGIGELLNLARSVGADPGGNVNMIDIQDKVGCPYFEGLFAHNRYRR